MPKDEFDPADPLELNGVAFLTDEDTTDSMCECFIEEFMRMGYGAKQVLALFRNPHYLGMNMVLDKRGEQFVRDRIAEIYARWGRPVAWPATGSSRHEKAQPSSTGATTNEDQNLLTAGAPIEVDATLTDPLGAPVPKLTL